MISKQPCPQTAHNLMKHKNICKSVQSPLLEKHMPGDTALDEKTNIQGTKIDFFKT